MAKGIKICKVCGNEYEACHTLRPNMNNEFRWQDVACCPEHGAEYLRRVLKARGKLTEPKPVAAEPVAAEPVPAPIQEPKEEPAKKPVRRTRKKKKTEDEAAAYPTV